eukprot:8468325-Pyramimonas_sp.AAC.1
MRAHDRRPIQNRRPQRSPTHASKHAAARFWIPGEAPFASCQASWRARDWPRRSRPTAPDA